MVDDEALPSDAEREKLWLAERRAPRGNWLTTLTATDAAAIFGVSKFASPIDVWLDKTGKSEASVRTEQQEAGHRMQRPILRWYADRVQAPIAFADPYAFTRSTEIDLIGASLDAVRTDVPMPVDAKNIGWPQPGEWGDDGTDQFPLSYAVQLVVQMYVTPGATEAHLAVLFRGQELRVYRITRDIAFEQNLIARMIEFHDAYIKTDTPPPIDGSTGWSDYIKRKFATHNAEIIDAPPELTVVAANLARVRAELKTLEAQKDEYSNVLKAAIGAARTVRSMEPAWAATYSRTKDSEYVDHEEVARLLALHIGEVTGKPWGPVLAEKVAQCRKVKQGYRRLTFNYNGIDIG